MKLLLDEMLPPSVAADLRGRGCDVVAVKDHEELWGLDDAGIVDVAVLDDRVVVTDNVADFVPIFNERVASVLPCSSLILLTSSGLNRNARSFKGELIRTLEEFLGSHVEPTHPQLWFV